MNADISRKTYKSLFSPTPSLPCATYRMRDLHVPRDVHATPHETLRGRRKSRKVEEERSKRTEARRVSGNGRGGRGERRG